MSFERQYAPQLAGAVQLHLVEPIYTASSSNVSFGKPYLGNPFNMKWNRGISTMSVPWNWVTNFIYQGPSLHGMNKLLKESLEDGS